MDSIINLNYLMPILVLFPIIGALITYLIGKKSKAWRNNIANIITILEFALIVALGFEILVDAKTLTFNIEGFVGQGVHFTMDSFRYTYVLITSFMWMITTVFSKEYFKTYKNRNRYYFFNLVTLGAVIAIFLSADLFTTFLFFETMSLASYVWVIHDERKEAFMSAETYLAVSIIGGLVMLMGLFMLQSSVGTLEIAAITDKVLALTDKTDIYIASFCLFVGFGAKAGAFPFHIWLPTAHAVAPAPASAILSGILTKTGIFGILIISCYILPFSVAFGDFILIVGIITMFLGALLGVFSVNFKRTLACSSMSQIGFILTGVSLTILLGEANAIAARGTLLHMVNHSLIKLVLFFVAGVIVLNTHKLNLNDIQGFGRKKPFLHFAYLMGGIGISGIPLGNGYLSKTLLHEGITEYIEFLHTSELTNSFLQVAQISTFETIFTISGGLTLAYILKLYICVFVYKNANDEVQKKYDDKKKYLSFTSCLALGVSAVILPILGIFPNIMNFIADATNTFMKSHHLHHEVEYFNHHNLTGAFNSIIIGILVYFIVIRLLLVKKENNKIKYMDRWPSWLDLEKAIYRPVVQYALPFIGAVFSRILDGIIDVTVVILRKTIYRDEKLMQQLSEGTKFTYSFGKLLDKLQGFKNKLLHKQAKESVSFTHKLAVLREEISENNIIIERSLSFGLFMFCIGICLTLVYILV